MSADNTTATVSIDGGPEVDLDHLIAHLKQQTYEVSADDLESLSERIAELSAERSLLEHVDAALRDNARLTVISTQLAELHSVAASARRRRVMARLSKYGLSRPAIDRAKHLEVILGDVTELLVNAQLDADDSLWESAGERLKSARKRLADAANLADLVNDLALAHARGAQLALPLE